MWSRTNTEGGLSITSDARPEARLEAPDARPLRRNPNERVGQQSGRCPDVHCQCDQKTAFSRCMEGQSSTEKSTAAHPNPKKAGDLEKSGAVFRHLISRALPALKFFFGNWRPLIDQSFSVRPDCRPKWRRLRLRILASDLGRSTKMDRRQLGPSIELGRWRPDCREKRKIPVVQRDRGDSLFADGVYVKGPANDSP